MRTNIYLLENYHIEKCGYYNDSYYYHQAVHVYIPVWLEYNIAEEDYIIIYISSAPAPLLSIIHSPFLLTLHASKSRSQFEPEPQEGYKEDDFKLNDMDQNIRHFHLLNEAEMC